MDEFVDVLKLIEQHMKNISISLRVIETRGRTTNDCYVGTDTRKLIPLYDFRDGSVF